MIGLLGKAFRAFFVGARVAAVTEVSNVARLDEATGRFQEELGT